MNNNLYILSWCFMILSRWAGLIFSHSNLSCTLLSALSRPLSQSNQSPAFKWECMATLQTALSLLCETDGVVVWSPFVGWYIYSPPYRLWFLGPAVLLVPSAPPGPGPPVKQKSSVRPVSLKFQPPIQMHLLHCSYCFYVNRKRSLLDLWLIIIQYNP